MLSGIPKRRKAVMFLTEEINGLDELRSGMSCTVLLATVLVSQPNKGSLNRNIQKTKLRIDWLVKNVLTRGSVSGT